MLEWDAKSEAIEALVVANHTQLPSPSMLRILLYSVCLLNYFCMVVSVAYCSVIWTLFLNIFKSN